MTWNALKLEAQCRDQDGSAVHVICGQNFRRNSPPSALPIRSWVIHELDERKKVKH